MDYSKHNTEKKRKQLRSSAVKSRKKIGFNIFRFVIITIVIVIACGIAAGIGGFNGVIDSAPEISINDIMPNKLKSTIFYSDGTPAVELVGAQSNRTIIDIDNLPDYVGQAFIAIEDERFYEHNGIDPKGIVRALVVGLTSGGDFSQGASTITQQLIKLTIFDGGGETDTLQRFKRKFQEWYLALELEKQLSKDEIMQAYMNTINLGRGAYGIESAAKRYFNKTSANLTISESAVLAAIAQSPTYNNPIDGQKVNSERREKILNNMLSLGFITEKQFKEAMADRVYDRIQEVNETMSSKETVYTWFEEAVIDSVIEDLQSKLGYSKAEANSAIYSGGLQIYMTQNRYMQNIVDRYYADDSNFSKTEYLMDWALTYKDSDGNEKNIDQNTLQSYYGSDNCDLLYDSQEIAEMSIADFKAGMGISEDDIIAERLNMVVQSQSSFVLMDQATGYVLALAGGRGDKTANRGFNRATDALRQPGSVFKPLAVFLPGLDACNLTLASTKEDEPYKLPDGTEIFNTNANSYSGTSTIREAITYSMNIVSVRFLMEDVTPALAIEYLQKVGLSTIDPENDAYGPLALGGIYNGVSNLELTAAYAAIANGGIYTQPIFYTKILDADGNVLIDNVPERHTAMKPTTAWLLTSALEDVVKKGTGTPARISNYGISEAGKTGTTNEYKDLWFVGYTPYYTAGIWLGYDNSVSMRGRISYSYTEHKTLWKNIMNEILDGYEDRDFEQPEGITRATICEDTGLLASSGCPAITEYLDEATAPTEYCNNHIAINICSHCGKKATSLTPDKYIITKYYNSYSSVPDEWCQDIEQSDTQSNDSSSDEKPDDGSSNDGNTSDGNTSDGNSDNDNSNDDNSDGDE